MSAMLERHWLKMATRTMMQFRVPNSWLFYRSVLKIQFVSKTRINFANLALVLFQSMSAPLFVPGAVISKAKQTTQLLVAIILKINTITLEWMQVYWQKWTNFLIRHAQQMSTIVQLNWFLTHKILRSYQWWQQFLEYRLKHIVPASVYLLFAQIANDRSLWSSFAWIAFLFKTNGVEHYFIVRQNPLLGHFVCFWWISDVIFVTTIVH